MYTWQGVPTQLVALSRKSATSVVGLAAAKVRRYLVGASRSISDGYRFVAVDSTAVHTSGRRRCSGKALPEIFLMVAITALGAPARCLCGGVRGVAAACGAAAACGEAPLLSLLFGGCGVRRTFLGWGVRGVGGMFTV